MTIMSLIHDTLEAAYMPGISPRRSSGKIRMVRTDPFIAVASSSNARDGRAALARPAPRACH